MKKVKAGTVVSPTAIVTLASFAAIGLIMARSETVTAGVYSAMKLSAAVLVPSLFPVLVISGVLLRCGFPEAVGRSLGKMLSYAFGVTPKLTPAVLAGMICGLPTGALAAKGIKEANHISDSEYQNALLAGSFASPAFIILGIGKGMLGSLYLGAVLWVIHIISILMSAFILRAVLGELGGKNTDSFAIPKEKISRSKQSVRPVQNKRNSEKHYSKIKSSEDYENIRDYKSTMNCKNINACKSIMPCKKAKTCKNITQPSSHSIERDCNQSSPLGIKRRPNLLTHLSESVSEASSSMLAICGTVTFFSVPASFISASSFIPSRLKCILISLLELTSGTFSIAAEGGGDAMLTLMAFAICWSGLSVHSQIALASGGLSFMRFICGKLISSVIAVALISALCMLSMI